ncbi:Asp-tRNA(Asn)/Glu-tRNA(Gln) amidotransferase subunit GatC [Mycoplasmopsis ciconiae]|uniref:Asp-tRNA(Asn)/Glu-tRNA(Gln) amidotransferase subunit GatC n=1 Tax=Mycoplasmopsis ciconiae TaxID=561067 RepID=A0ABU7MN02_9BACT|nr:Asp-tRNA(Asn)/Glu-tRNA(Gln) amidotransferase subunit GatC [Mycoplasmopsis ciconiae]
MKEISKEKLIEIANSLMLQPSEDILDSILKDWEELQNHLLVLNKIDTSNVEPMSHINEDLYTDFLRDDEVNNQKMISKEVILENAAQKNEDFVITKKVVE